MHARHLAVAALFALTARGAAAQTAPKTASVVPTVGFSVGSLAIDPAAAAGSSVGDRAWGIQLDGGIVVRNHFLFGIDLGGQFLDDQAQFTEMTSGG